MLNAKKMTTEEKIKFLKDNIEPLSDQIYGNGFRASAYLTDETFIPGIMPLIQRSDMTLMIKMTTVAEPLK